MDVPVIETERLILRGHMRDDFPAFVAMRADPMVMKFMGKGDLLDEEESWMRFQSMFGHWQIKGFGAWAIEERTSGALIGSIGYADKKRPPSHPASGAPEMGWSLASSMHGKGLASEALRAALTWGRSYFGPARVVCVISDDNSASLRLAERHGFKQFATASRYGLGRRVFERML
ncbi:MAG TPA: GNAT family N-acetyltransferase [Rhizomicrobium sp.]|nr:GNAT family N-acetyltransferase [Rhizomicrobium sp.]